MFKNLICEKHDNVYVIKISREKYLNSLSEEVLKELEMAVDILNDDEEVYVGVIIGQGKAFVAGADIDAMKDMNFEQARRFSKLGTELFRKIENCDKPIIAGINGFCLGGGLELAMSCDLRIASTKAKFGQVETNLGILPGFGGTQRLPRIVGLGKAKELIYTCSMVNAEEALRIGLVNKVVPLENLMEEARKMAATICANAPIAVKLCKDAINRGMQVDIDKAIEVEAEDFGKCFDSEDQVEGMTAFLERRAKNFKNK